MLFHLGTLWRLNETGILLRLASFSGVSGGSTTVSEELAEWCVLVTQEAMDVSKGKT
jgi:NTE family protein